MSQSHAGHTHQSDEAIRRTEQAGRSLHAGIFLRGAGLHPGLTSRESRTCPSLGEDAGWRTLPLCFHISSLGCPILDAGFGEDRGQKQAPVAPAVHRIRTSSRPEGVKYRALRGSVFRALRGVNYPCACHISGEAAGKTVPRARERHGQPMVRQPPVQQGTAGLWEKGPGNCVRRLPDSWSSASLVSSGEPWIWAQPGAKPADRSAPKSRSCSQGTVACGSLT